MQWNGQLTLRDLFWLVALVACMCGGWSYGGNPVSVLFALACAFTIRFWQVDHLRAKRRVRSAPKQKILPLSENPYQPPQEVGERSEVLTPFLRAVGGFVLGTLGFAILFAVALAMLVFLIVWSLTQ
jgi:hypothetical protein